MLDNLTAMVKHFNQIRIHRKCVRKVCNINIEESYKNPLYDERFDIKEDLKKDIMVYKRVYMMHDLSCYNPKEFIPTAIWLYNNKVGKKKHDYCKNNNIEIPKKVMDNYNKFLDAEMLHLQKNKYARFACNNFRRYDLIEMVIDWEAKLKQEGSNMSVQEFYLKNYRNKCMTPNAIIQLEDILGLRHFSMTGFSWNVISKTLLQLKRDLGEEKFNKLIGNKIKDELNISMYDLLP